MGRRVVLLDGNNLAMRSFHAAHGQMSSGGEDTGGLQLFVNGLAKHLREERPTHFVVCWDSGGSDFRLKLYPEYKAARRAASPLPEDEPHRPLFVLIKTFLMLAGLAQWQLPGTEADDLIAAAWRAAEPRDEVVILSADKDLLQLLDSRTSQVRFSSYGTPTDRWTRQRVIEDLGHTPEQIPLMMALTGDASDGVPGMRGIGPKKALKMLRAADWDLDKAMAPYPEHHQIVATSLALVDLSYAPVEVPALPEFHPVRFTGSSRPGDSQDWDSLIAFLDHYELRTIRERLHLGTLWG